ncbi:hypothetical protein YA0868_01915 [Pseudomonas syringae]|uniref:hypothetical protein n=1 Tax=Pseudomonas syringae TaxID=317 RepID=UPI0018E65D7F|nr:hypothetical protein [Pseudomonas syringae]MBI6558100.1 hypothetical protein [Pseudomonas syringae]MBI6569191.1 hypothetical protein [Pseudomonas syringae]MBI6585192.1 hypothetical protein [Pseudomonas syringae]
MRQTIPVADRDIWMYAEVRHSEIVAGPQTCGLEIIVCDANTGELPRREYLARLSEDGAEDAYRILKEPWGAGYLPYGSTLLRDQRRFGLIVPVFGEFPCELWRSGYSNISAWRESCDELNPPRLNRLAQDPPCLRVVDDVAYPSYQPFGMDARRVLRINQNGVISSLDPRLGHHAGEVAKEDCDIFRMHSSSSPGWRESLK